MERISRPLVSASRYELIASGPAFVSAFTVEERSLTGKYRIDLKLVVVSLLSPKRASVASLPASATAIALLVVPKSRPITRCISLLVPQGDQRINFGCASRRNVARE